MRYCDCGCGRETKGNFVPGHDAKHKSNLLNRWRNDDDMMALAELRTRGWLSTVKTDRTFGIEIECFVPGTRTTARDRIREALAANNLNNWRVKGDGSIRNLPQGYTGIEVVSPILKGEDGKQQVYRVTAILAEIGAKVNKTCGLHIHHGVDDFKLKHFKEALRLYGRYEDQLDRMVAKSRRGNDNRYCRSVKNANPTTIHNARSLKQLRRALNNDRYHKFNLEAYVQHGTIEIRHHQGTVEAEKILAWLEIGQALLQKAKNGAVNSEASIIFDILELPAERIEFWHRRVERLERVV